MNIPCSSGSYRVKRGGSWLSGAGELPVGACFGEAPGGRFAGLGFRLLRTAE